jgi:hypothetical protein
MQSTARSTLQPGPARPAEPPRAVCASVNGHAQAVLIDPTAGHKALPKSR